MVKKITEAGGVKRPQEISSVREVSEVTGVSGVKAVTGVSNVSSLGRVEGLGAKLTPTNQHEVIATIEREAEKIFAGKKIPRKRQKTITDALKMAVLAATAREDDEEVDTDVLKKLKDS